MSAVLNSWPGAYPRRGRRIHSTTGRHIHPAASAPPCPPKTRCPRQSGPGPGTHEPARVPGCVASIVVTPSPPSPPRCSRLPLRAELRSGGGADNVREEKNRLPSVYSGARAMTMAMATASVAGAGTADKRWEA